MAKYYILVFLIAGAVLFYIFSEDPCNKNISTDFSGKYPNYTILESTAREGSPDKVHCHILYRKPDSEQVYEDIWVYLNTDAGWRFSEILATHKREQVP